ncbi:MAG: DUF2878 domain-containing protein [Pseudomonadota bacterium]
MPPRLHLLTNIAAFQLGWFACVLGGAWQHAWAGSLIALAAILLHLWMARHRIPEVKLLAFALLIGVGWESLIVSLGLMRYSSGNFLHGVAPHWILALWPLFATTLNVSLTWLRGRPWLAAVFGAVGGPLAYWSGQRLGGVQIPDLLLGLGAQCLGWAVFMPLLVWLAARYNGFASPPHPDSGRV